MFFSRLFVNYSWKFLWKGNKYTFSCTDVAFPVIVIITFSEESKQNGLCLLIDARYAVWRVARSFIRLSSTLLLDSNVTSAIAVRPDGFWDKRVDNCTKSHKEGEVSLVEKNKNILNILILCNVCIVYFCKFLRWSYFLASLHSCIKVVFFRWPHSANLWSRRNETLWPYRMD